MPNEIPINPDFELWTAGDVADPDGWSSTGTSHVVSKESTIVKTGTYSAKVTQLVGACDLNQPFTATKGIAYWKGRTITLGMWIYATDANRVRLAYFDDGYGTYILSGYHPGDSTWRYLTVTTVVHANATIGYILPHIDNGASVTVYYDDANVSETGENFFLMF